MKETTPESLIKSLDCVAKREAEEGEYHVEEHVDYMAARLIEKMIKSRPSKTMLERHYEIRCQVAKDEKERADKYEAQLIKINHIVFAVGLQLGSDEYFVVRGMGADAQKAKHEREKS